MVGLKSRHIPVDDTVLRAGLSSSSPAERMRACELCGRLARQGANLADTVPRLSELLGDVARAPQSSSLNWYAADALGLVASVAENRESAEQALREACEGKVATQRCAGYGLSVLALQTRDLALARVLLAHAKTRVREGVFHGFNKLMSTHQLDMALDLIETVDLGRWHEADKVNQKKADALLQTLQSIVRWDVRGAEELYRCAHRAMQRAIALSIEDDPLVISAIQFTLAQALKANPAHTSSAELQARLR